MASVVFRKGQYISSLSKTILPYKVGALRSPVNLANTTVRCASAWNKDWKPGPYPKTPEEREAAAKKYGLIPEDYEPYPDDGSYPYGDYPKLPPVSGEARSPYEAWDFKAWKKNYGEPMHTNFDIYTETRYNVNADPNPSTPVQLACFLGLMLVSAGLFLLGEKYKIYKPLMPKQYPKEGEVHYTFEPAS